MMQLSDGFALPTGHFHLEVTRGGLLVEVIDEPNLVVDSSKDAQAHLMAGVSTGYFVSLFGVGTNGSTPVAGNTVLTNSYTNDIGVAFYPASGQVSFPFALGSAEANGKSIMEFGLLTSTGILIARKVRPVALDKTADISFSGTWTLNF